MARIMLDLTKTIDQNASEYFEKAKKMRKKLKGADEAVQKTAARLEKLRKQSMKIEAAEAAEAEKEGLADKSPAKKEW